MCSGAIISFFFHLLCFAWVPFIITSIFVCILNVYIYFGSEVFTSFYICRIVAASIRNRFLVLMFGSIWGWKRSMVEVGLVSVRSLGCLSKEVYVFSFLTVEDCKTSEVG